MGSVQDPLMNIRCLVYGLQGFGSFPYRWRKSTPPRFSVVLCLWSVFTRLLILVRNMFMVMPDQENVPEYLGNMISNIASLIALSAYAVGSVFSVCISSRLAGLLNILANLTSDKTITATDKNIPRKDCRFFDFLTLLLLTNNGAICLAQMAASLGRSNITSSEVLINLLTITLATGGDTLFQFMYKEMLKTLGVYVNKCAEWAMVDQRDGEAAWWCEDPKISSMMARTIHLEHQFIKVEEALADVMKSFGILLTSTLASTSVLLIIALYLILQGEVSIVLILLVHNSVAHLLFLSCSSQLYVDKVYRLIQHLGAIGRVNIGGWYALNSGTMVSMGSFVATYLVVLLQVGRQPVSTPTYTDSHTDSPTYTDSTPL